MRKLLLSILLMIAPVTMAKSDQEAELFNRANDYYSSKDYQKALELYVELTERGINNPDLYYNLGNTYYKLNQIGYAIFSYERALLLKPFNRDTRENLEYIRRSMKERVLPLYTDGFFRTLRVASSYIRPRFITIIEILFFTMLILFLYLYLFIPLRRNSLKKYIFLFAVLFVLFGVANFSYHDYEEKHPKGIIVIQEIPVLNAPIAESEILYPLYEGTKVKLLETRGEWLRITLEDGREGWIFSQSMLFI